MKAKGYALHMFYLWIPSPELALKRIEDRVASGGHDVPELAVRRRFDRTWHNLTHDYHSLLESLFVFDNSSRIPVLTFDVVAGTLIIHDPERYSLMTWSNDP